MNYRFETPTPPPPRRSKSSMYAPSSGLRKFTSTVNRSISLYGNSRKKRLFLSERNYTNLLPDQLPINLHKTEDLMQIGLQEVNNHSYDSAISTFTAVLSIDPSHIEGLYYRGMCYFKLTKPRSALPDLLKVTTINPTFNKFAYYLLAMCFEQINDVVTAVRSISKSIYHYPRFVKGYILRGKLYNAQQKYDKALSDFRKAVSINPDEGTALIGMAESLEKIGDLSYAYKILTQALGFPDIFSTALIKRAGLLINQKKYELALSDFESVLIKFPSHAEAYFGKGKLMLDTERYSDAVLCFEQAIKNDRFNELTNKAVYYLGYIKVKEKDFYGALHQLDRVSGATSEQKLLRLYAEGVIFLVKRKYKEGIANFVKIIRKRIGNEEYISSSYEHLGFAYCSLRVFSKALKYLRHAESMDGLCKASAYNVELTQGYLHAEKQELQQAITHFKKSATKFNLKPEPLLLQALILMEEAQKIEPLSTEVIKKCEDLLEDASKLRKDSEVALCRGIVRYLLGKFEDALDDAKFCVEKADENIAEHYVFRGLCFAALSNYSEAVNDFSVSLQLNDSLEYIYDYRGRCAYLMDDSDLAYMDFQKLVSLNESSPRPYIQTALVLMHSSSFSGAIASLENANAIGYTVEAGMLKVKAFILQYNMESAVNELNIILDFNQNLVQTRKDRELLVFIQELSVENPKDFPKALKKLDKLIEPPGEIFDNKILYWYRGVFLLYLEKYEEAILSFQKIVEILQNREKKVSSEQTLILEEQNCEVLYNIALCCLKISKQRALSLFSDLSKILNKKHKGQLLFLCALVQLELGSPKSAEKLLQEAYKCDPDTVNPYLNKQSIIIKPLNTTNDLALQFPLLQPFDSKKVKLRPAICLPKPDLPSIEFSIDYRVLDFIKISCIAPKPEPPWLKRSNGSIMFTDNIIDIDHEPVSQAVSKANLEVKPKKTARSGEVIRRADSEKESIYLQSNEGEQDESQGDEESEDVPEIVLRKIKEMCC